MSISSAFAGGLFLSIGILHILPEAEESFQTYYEQLNKEKEKNTQQKPAKYTNIPKQKKTYKINSQN